ncbi:MAG TPA: hypothetical protein VEX68_18340 [Bryobacteraceae bacterium]|nr:hypothetical protein [Bryobacteraceae bacterium]
MKRVIATVLFAISTSVAQDPGNTAILPRVPQQWDELRQYLVLSEAQVSTLEQIMKNRSQAEQQIYLQISEKERQMYNLLQQGSNDSTTIGRLMVEINNLRRQLPLSGAPYRTQALAAINDAQKAKVGALVEALKLQSPAWQAVQLNLMDSPHVPDARILPYPMPSSGLVSTAEAAINVR